MEIIRKDYLCNYIYAPFSYLVNIRNSVRYEGGENIPEKGPALLLPKHQHNMDIFLEADFLMNKKGRFGNWVMKNTLSEVLKYFGAVKIMRKKDRVKQGISKLDFLIYNQEVDEYLKFLYCGEGKMVIVHPEGTRVRNNMGKIKDGLINHFRRFEEELGIQIPVIPIGRDRV